MFLFLGGYHVQIVIFSTVYTIRFVEIGIKRFLHHIKRKISYTHCYLKHSFYRLNMFCTCHHCKQRFLVLLSRLFLAYIKSVHRCLFHGGRAFLSGLCYHSPAFLKTEIVYTPIPTDSVRPMLSVLNENHEIINAIIL